MSAQTVIQAQPVAPAETARAASDGRRPYEVDGLDSYELGAPMRALSFQNRIAVVALLTAVAVLIAATAIFVVQEWRMEAARFVQNQTTLASVVAARLGPEAGQPALVDEGLKAFSTAKRVESAQVYDLRGVRIASYRRPAEGKAQKGAPAEVQVPLLSQGRPVGRLVVTGRSDALGDTLPRFIALGGSLFFVAAGLALFTGRWLAARVTKPVNRLSAAMREVARSGNYDTQVARGEDDEFGRLTDSFNALLAELHRRDVDLRRAMVELVEARDAAEAANILKSQFLANMSHEIRTPLNGVLAMAQIMAMGELSKTQRERLDVISRSGEALLAVLNDVLDLSKIEAGRMELEFAEFDPRCIGDRLRTDNGELAARKGLAFQVETDPSAEGLRSGDCPRILQILNNLISNAVKFTEAGAIDVRIAGDGPDGADGLHLTVSDSGIGIPADKLPLLFQKFSQLDASTTRRFGGTGLGLAICRELALLMGGRIWAESREGEGSTFHVSLPLARIAPAKDEPAPTQGRRAANRAAAAAQVPVEAPVEDPAPADNDAEAQDERPLRVLAAEDNPTNQLVLKSVMATFGVDLHIVPHGRAAVDAWAQEQFDVILMDIQMPEMDGIAATRLIRAAEAETGKARTPIIALSANAMTHQVKEYLAAGMDRHVAKPIELSKLHSALLEVLGDGEDADEPAVAAGASA